MDFLIGSKKYVNALNQDYQIRLNFDNRNILFNDDTINIILDESQQFQVERNACTKYLFYGKIENLIDDSLNFNNNILNNTNYDVILGYSDTYEVLDNFKNTINNITGNSLTINLNTNFFKNDIILLYKDKSNFFIQKIIDIINSGTTLIALDNIPSVVDINNYTIIPSVALYKRFFNPIIDNNYINFYNSAYSINIFNDQIYQYNTYKNINLSGYTDSLGLPITNIFLKFQNQNVNNIFYKNSTLTNTGSSIIDIVQIDLNNITITQNDYSLYSFTQNNLDYYYIPYFKVDFRFYSNNINSTYKNEIFDYPSYAFVFNDGNIIYKNLLNVGYFEENNNGIDYPYVNDLNYLFSDIKFNVRRVVPIFTGSTTTVIVDDTTFNNTYINSDTGKERLC